jgi:hypothetical protein
MRRHTSVRSVPIVSPRVQASGVAPAASSAMRCGVTRFVDREGLFDTERMERGDATAVRRVLDGRPHVGLGPSTKLRSGVGEQHPPAQSENPSTPTGRTITRWSYAVLEHRTGPVSRVQCCWCGDQRSRALRSGNPVF